MENQLLKVQTKSQGWNAARSVASMKLSNVATEVNSFVVMLGSDKFTEIYLKTESGNIYRVIRAVSGSWVLEFLKIVEKNHCTILLKLSYIIVKFQ